MSDFEAKLESILNNPQAMGQIMSLAQSLGGGGSPPPPAASPSPVQQQQQPPSQPLSSPLEGFISDPNMLSGILQMLGQYNNNDDQRVALLNALRPFVREQRYAKIDKAIQIAKLARMIRMGLDMFRAKEDGNV